MLKHFQPSSTAKILVVGDVILDRYVAGDTTRVSPEAPVPVVRVSGTEERPGGAANVAVNVRALGVRTSLLGVTGDDEAADSLDLRLRALDVTGHFHRQAGFPTITKLRVLSQHQQLLRLDYECEPGMVDGPSLLSLFRAILPGHDLLVLSDYAKGSLGGVDQFIALAAEQGIPVLVDPKGGDFSRYRGASLLTPNLREFEAVAGRCSSDEAIVERGRALCRELALQALLITRGEHGMLLIEAGGDSVNLPAHAHEVFDVTGAGDTVIAALAAARASGYGLAEAVAYANLAAGLVVAKLGTASVTAAELNRSLFPAAGGAGKILDRAALEALVPRLDRNGRRVVFTNGCFDILHAGHVRYLEQARTLGDLLIVAVNDDASVARLKGEARPVNALAERMAVLAGLAAVDWVVPFAGDTPEDLVRLVRPDCLVKGGDYAPDQVAGAGFVESCGGDVVILPYLENYSTSRLIATLRGGGGKDG